MAKKATKPQEVKVNCGPFAPAGIYTATGKIARATHNAERHEEFNGKTIKEILSLKPTRMTLADIKYDVKTGFITIE
jgi:hypothetical protein|tara:strand:+ start:361 stop:591 length:231 start_codon:yes stop_codon:yes gene_type:complete